jgi:uncharacterized protein
VTRSRVPGAARPEVIQASRVAVRRLTVTKQHLAGKLPVRPDTDAILSVIRDLPYVQWDPVSIVAPSHILSLWCRLGDFRPSDLDRLLWKDKRLFQHWTPMAAIVLTEDYPLYRSLMERYPESLTKSWGTQREQAKRFLARHAELRRKMIRELRDGPLLLGEFSDHARTRRDDGDWSPGSDVEHMLFHLLMRGEVMVVGHRGAQNVWGLSDPFLPSWVDRTELSESDFELAAAQRALRALGTATPAEIHYYFPRGRYQNLRAALARLEAESTVRRVQVEEFGSRDERYVHAKDVAALESMATAAGEPRVSLLPPFDNLICNTARTKRLFDFEYVREQFLPKEKRRFGTYVLPILWGERLIGRIDPRLDKAAGELVINSVHAEPAAPRDREVASRIGETIDRLAAFLGAGRVTYTARVPAIWKSSLH